MREQYKALILKYPPEAQKKGLQGKYMFYFILKRRWEHTKH